jgi:LAO/AO transport system kinase
MPGKESSMPKDDVACRAEMVERLINGDVRTAARLITMAENGLADMNGFMKQIYPHTGKGLVIGITGPGGAGKSSLVDQLIGKYRKLGRKVGVVAVDPSSPFSGGALLGDRIRFKRHSVDEGVYVRSVAARGHLGGLAKATTDVVKIMEAMGNHVVMVETLGVGQDEIDVMHVAQTCLLVLTPGMGDEIQAMKSGIMEIADIIVLNKFDLEGAEVCLRNLEATLGHRVYTERSQWLPRVVPTIASGIRDQTITGIDDLVHAIEAHQAYLDKSGDKKKILEKRIEHELTLILKNEVEKLCSAGLCSAGKKQYYINAIIEKEMDPYTAVQQVLAFLAGTERTE